MKIAKSFSLFKQMPTFEPIVKSIQEAPNKIEIGSHFFDYYWLPDMPPNQIVILDKLTGKYTLVNAGWPNA